MTRAFALYRNVADFTASSLNVVEPSQFLQVLISQTMIIKAVYFLLTIFFPSIMTRPGLELRTLRPDRS